MGEEARGRAIQTGKTTLKGRTESDCAQDLWHKQTKIRQREEREAETCCVG